MRHLKKFEATVFHLDLLQHPKLPSENWQCVKNTNFSWFLAFKIEAKRQCFLDYASCCTDMGRFRVDLR
jgi:hypothetical protein